MFLQYKYTPHMMWQNIPTKEIKKQLAYIRKDMQIFMKTLPD
jgi:hypothetical protein